MSFHLYMRRFHNRKYQFKGYVVKVDDVPFTSKPMNNSSTSVFSVIQCQRSAFQKYQFVPLMIIIVIGFVANIMVIFAGGKKNSRRKYTTNSFILNLAVADLGMTCFYIPIHVIEYTLGLTVQDWVCKYVVPIRETFSFMSIMVVTILSIVRMLQVHRTHVLSMRLTHTLIFLMWFLAYLTVSFPLSFVFHHTPDETCDPQWTSPRKKKIHVGLLNSLIFVPLVLTTCCYICIILKMRKFNRSLSSTKIVLQLKGQKISLLLCMLIIANWLGLAPFLIYSLLKVFIEFYTKYPCEEWSIISVLFLSTSAINPVLILIASKDYRKEIGQSFYKRDRIVPLVLQRVRVEAKAVDCFEDPVVIQVNKLA